MLPLHSLLKRFLWFHTFLPLRPVTYGPGRGFYQQLKVHYVYITLISIKQLQHIYTKNQKKTVQQDFPYSVK